MVTKMGEYIQYRWKMPALVVAYTYMAIGYLVGAASVVSIVLFLYLTMKMKRGTIHQETQDLFPGLEPDTENLYIGGGFLLVASGALTTAAIFYTAFSLEKAASNYEKPREALRKCGIWWNVNLLLVSISCIALTYYYNRWYLWIWIVFQFVCILVVSRFMREIKEETNKLIITKQKYDATAADLAQRRGYNT